MSSRHADGEVEVPEECLHSSGQKTKAQRWVKTAYTSKFAHARLETKVVYMIDY